MPYRAINVLMILMGFGVAGSVLMAAAPSLPPLANTHLSGLVPVLRQCESAAANFLATVLWPAVQHYTSAAIDYSRTHLWPTFAHIASDAAAYVIQIVWPSLKHAVGFTPPNTL